LDDDYGPDNYYAGLSPAQGFILRRSVWDKLKVWVMYPGLHTFFPRQARKFIMHGLGENWSPRSQWSSWGDADTNAEDTRILWIDLTSKSKQHTLFLRTPFSKHYPWKDSKLLPRCDSDQTREMIGNSKGLNYLVDASSQLHMSMGKVCENNPSFGSSKFGLHCNKAIERKS